MNIMTGELPQRGPASAAENLHFPRGMTMLKRTWSIGAMVALLLGGTAGAQQPGALIPGGIGQHTLFDDNLGPNTAGLFARWDNTPQPLRGTV
ncbi:MAG: hypothetical protein H0X64_06645, partial [Gemmatimonadaceae bacterium]|nr:hypothetical protein [Gemmatimonadaceae bacterium]